MSETELRLEHDRIGRRLQHGEGVRDEKKTSVGSPRGFHLDPATTQLQGALSDERDLEPLPLFGCLPALSS